MGEANRFGWLLAATGLTGTLIALGYVVRVAQADLLGVSTYDPERGGYLLAAGDLITHSVLLLLNWQTMVALLTAVAVVVGIQQCMRKPRFRDMRSFLALGVGILCALHLLFFALPTTPIKNVLFTSVCLNRSFDVSGVFRWRTEEVWKQVLCSRVSKYNLASCGNPSPQIYRHELDNTFTIAVLTAILLWVAGWHILRFVENASIERSLILWEFSRTVLITLLLALLFGLAYQYGKVVRPTEFPSAEVNFADDAALKPSESCDDEPLNSFILVSDNGTDTILYRRNKCQERVWIVRNTDITIHKISALDDPLTVRIGFHQNTCNQGVK